MPATTEQPIKRQGRDGKLKSLGAAAGRKLLEGTMAFMDANGLATDVKVDADTVFLGVVHRTVDNSAGSNGDRDVEFWTDGDFELPSSGLAVTDVDGDIFAVDNFTTTKAGAGNPKIGVLSRFVAADIGVVSLKGLGES